MARPYVRLKMSKKYNYSYAVVCECDIGDNHLHATRYFTEVVVPGGTSRADIYKEAQEAIRKDPRYSTYPCLREARKQHRRMNWKCHLVGSVIRMP